MKALRRAAARFRDAGSVRVLAVAVLAMAVSAPLYAGGDRSRPHNSSGSERFAVPRSESSRPSSPPSFSPPPSSGSTSSGNNDGGSHRTAVPRPGAGNEPGSRQPPHDRGGRDGHGGFGHGGGYYPYSSWAPYWGWGWGWGWGGGWWSWWWGDGYSYPYGNPYGYDRYGYSGRYDRDGSMGALDVDVSPGKTEVWIDGRYVGIADNFDGFPQYLWLDKGVYDLVLYREGYKTIARQITIYPGTVIDIDDRMQPGDSVRPEDLATKTHERRDERVRSEDERREEIARRGGDGMDDWRERARRRMEDRDRYDHDAGNGRDEDNDEPKGTADDGSGRLHLEVEPADASVYLDGKFVGTGTDLAHLHQGLRLEPGEHRIAVVRPGRKAQEQEVTVAAGQSVDMEIELESLE